MLFKQGLIGKIFDPNSKTLYLRITDKGQEFLNSYFRKHKQSFAKRKSKVVPTIVKIAG